MSYTSTQKKLFKKNLISQKVFLSNFYSFTFAALIKKDGGIGPCEVLATMTSMVLIPISTNLR